MGGAETGATLERVSKIQLLVGRVGSDDNAYWEGAEFEIERSARVSHLGLFINPTGPPWYYMKLPETVSVVRDGNLFFYPTGKPPYLLKFECPTGVHIVAPKAARS